MSGLREMALRALLAAALCVPALAGAEGWPAAGQIVYQVSMGNNGPLVGEARQSWSRDGSEYRITNTVRTVGLAALIKNMQYVQRSEGRAGADGLRPARFSVEREGRQAERVEFDWKAAQLRFTRKERTREAALGAGAQDVLSLWHQIAQRADQPLPASAQVVTGRKVAESTLAWVGEETLELPLGKLQTRRLKARAVDGSMEIDVWFAPARNMLPVRIRMVDDEGEVLEQRASELRIGAVTQGAGE
ncbi:DUF3108 domain-containing protein [Pseudothauera nasutitermitis]|nr:DUF3108 domain-containing protein [Pseudothauera nasutitermitis]